MKKALVCLSGGLDSTVSLFWCEKKYSEIHAVFFNYGQKALFKERKASRYFAGQIGATFEEIDLGFLGKVSGSALNQADKSVPQGDFVDLNDLEKSEETAKAVWVPNRNGLFINVASAIAEAKGFDDVVVGFNAEEANTFPDNSKEFIEAVNEALKFSSQGRVQVVAPTLELQKSGIVRLGRELSLNFHKLWPCYESGDEICGICESCKRYLRAIKESSI